MTATDRLHEALEEALAELDAEPGRPLCTAPGCENPAMTRYVVFCSVAHREDHFAALGAGDVRLSKWHNIDPLSASWSLDDPAESWWAQGKAHP